jgi:hypothetical protein
MVEAENTTGTKHRTESEPVVENITQAPEANKENAGRGTPDEEKAGYRLGRKEPKLQTRPKKTQQAEGQQKTRRARRPGEVSPED